MKKIRPLGTNIAVTQDQKKGSTKGGILLPDKSESVPLRGTVVSVGEGVDDRCLKIGDIIVFNKYSGTNIKIDNKEYLIMKLEDVLAVIE